VDEGTFAIRGERSSDIVIRVDDGIARIAVADFQIEHITSAAVDQVVGIARPGFEAGAHAWTQRRFALVGHENGFALDDIDELVFAQMGVAKRRHVRGVAHELVI